MKVIFVSLLLFGVAWGVKKVTPKAPTQSAPRINCECGKRNTGRIYAGITSRKNQYTWMAALELAKNKQQFCGGSIITQKHVLTAAHCFFDEETNRQNIFENDVDIVVGGHDLSAASDPNTQRLKVEKMILHEMYSPCSDHNDIAVLVTVKKMLYNTNVGPICMPIEPLKANLTGKAVKVTGWGYTSKADSAQRIKDLREIDLDVVNNDRCNHKEAFQICAFKKGKSVCKGDGGGALVWLNPATDKFTQVGLVSNDFAKECGKNTDPGIYTDVTAYYCWIDQQIWPLRKEVHTCHEI